MPKQVPVQAQPVQQMQVAYTVTTTTTPPKPAEKPAETTYNYTIKL
jgi:hypothetical protein